MLIPDPDRPDTFITSTGQTITNVHDADRCYGSACTIHRPTDHHMLNWPLHWWSERSMFVRLCAHSIPHPDPDGGPRLAHECDGCCIDNVELEPI